MANTLRMLVKAREDGSDIALLQDGTLVEYYHEPLQADTLVGAVFLGRVERVLPDIKAAFVKLGLPLNGFLPLHEADSYHALHGAAPLMSGQDVIVQVKKDAKGGKGVFLTRDVALAGQYVLLMPCNRFVGVSKRVTDPDDHRRAKQLGQSLCEDGRFGVIVRHAALAAAEQDVRTEAQLLYSHWQSIMQNVSCIKSPALLHRDLGMAAVLLRDYGARHCVQVVSDLPSPDGLQSQWTTVPAIELEAQWRGARVQEQLQAALARKVLLPDGASLVIDEREALHTIDLNSGRCVNANANADQSLALQENLRAVDDIARHIRLRNLSGIILVDFIDMAHDGERERVLQAMQDAVCDDRVKTVIHGFTRLGILEMTRKRTRDTLRDSLTEPCTACHETGRRLSVR